MACPRSSQARERIAERLSLLTDYFAPLGQPRLSTRHVSEPDVVLGLIDFGGRAHPLADAVSFGVTLPASLDSAERLLEADQTQLRGIDGPLAAVAVSPDRCRIVTAVGAPTMLYEAASQDVEVWSTHAAPAAYVAHGRATVESDALPEFLAAHFVGGNRTLVRGVSAVDSATDIVIDVDGIRVTSFWPARERWRLLDPANAIEHAETALLAALPRRLERQPDRFLGLTGGVDSRVAAVALQQLGVDFEAFTFGEAHWPDVGEASKVAATLGIRHRHSPIEWNPDENALRSARAEACWHDGAIPIGFGRIRWPSGIGTFVTGGGGETGRAFYYRGQRPRSEASGSGEPRRVLRAALEWGIAGAADSAVARLRRSIDTWISEAEAVGVDGLRVLDVLYAEQRLRRWGRGMMGRVGGPPIPVFSSPEIQRAFVSMSLEDRVGDGFHRHFLGRHAPDLLPEPSPAPKRRSLQTRLIGRVRRVLSGGSRTSEPLLAARWAQYPQFRTWIADEILRSELLADGLGERWRERTRSGFLSGDGAAETLALWAAGPVALAAALKTLPSDRAPGNES